MALPEPARALFRPPFRNYQFDAAYDEMFEGPGVPRSHYQALFQTLLELPPEEMRKSQQANRSSNNNNRTSAGWLLAIGY